ncbi:MAG: hypothetical protein NZ750_05585 [Anaerolineae bacterium]|nr:hypothetical protein [Anaerolineae bacterium]MDW8172920.1 hypothetical protein [Anaerolineae bacterium]
MLDSPIVQVILGMVFVFALFSILVTQVNGVLSAILQLRARHLRDGIAQMIDDPTLRAKVLTHPLIRLVKSAPIAPNRQLTEEEAAAIVSAKLNAVNRIEPKTFVKVLMNIVRSESDAQIYEALLKVLNDMPKGMERRKVALAIARARKNSSDFEELRQVVLTVPEPLYRDALLEAIDKAEELVGKGTDSSNLQGLLAGLRSVKNDVFRTVMQTVIATSQTMEEAEEQLVAWFNEGMTRASESFKANMQLISILTATAIVFVLNVDSIHIARTLWNDPTLRAAVATAARTTDLQAIAGDVLATPTPAPAPTALPVPTESGVFLPTPTPFVFPSPTPEDFGLLPLETEEAEVVPETPQPTPTTDAQSIVSVASSEQATIKTVETVTQAIAQAQTTLNVISGLNLPLGWRFVSLEGVPRDVSTEGFFNDTGNIWNLLPLIGSNPYWFSLLMTKLVGLAVTIIAISQGAPFWFDILNRVARGGR